MVDESGDDRRDVDGSHEGPRRWQTTLQRAGIEGVPVADLGDASADPQLHHRGHFVTLTHPCMGECGYEHNGFRLSDAPAGFTHSSPTLGEHNEYVLGEVLGPRCRRAPAAARGRRPGVGPPGPCRSPDPDAHGGRRDLGRVILEQVLLLGKATMAPQPAGRSTLGTRAGPPPAADPGALPVGGRAGRGARIPAGGGTRGPSPYGGTGPGSCAALCSGRTPTRPPSSVLPGVGRRRISRRSETARGGRTLPEADRRRRGQSPKREVP